jgi:hypothetical protein
MSRHNAQDRILNLVVAGVDERSLEARQDAIAVVLRGPAGAVTAFRAVLCIPVAEALAEVLRAGLAAARKLRVGNAAPPLPRLARVELGVHPEQPVAILQVRLSDGREVAATVEKTDLIELRRAMDDAICRWPCPAPPRLSQH